MAAGDAMRRHLRPLALGARSGAVALVAAASLGGAAAQSPGCRLIEDPEKRLACYDAEASKGAGGGEFAILIAVQLSVAELNCPYRIEESRLRRLLAHHGLGFRDIYTLPRSQSLKEEIEKVASSFKTDKAVACATAWKNFGPDAPFEGFLQRR